MIRVNRKSWQSTEKFLGLLLVVLLCCQPAALPADEASELEFFEARIRPVLVEHCYACHNSGGKAEGELKLDSRAGIRAGGERGAAVVPGKPKESLLLTAIEQTEDDLRMPEDSGKLEASVIADFARWIESGAEDPRDAPPSADELATLTAWETVRARRMRWWSYQPVAKLSVAKLAAGDVSANPIDRFLLAKLADAQLAFANPAPRPMLVRRLAFALHGLPPTGPELDVALGDESPVTVEALVDNLLRSPRFGEHFARHWMDWFRYAESHGSEGDPEIPYAWRYRDYLIRALNDDVPYDQLVREHLAGDLLADPRLNRELGLNESALGIGHFRMVQHGYAPTDALDEQVRFTDNQIDVVSKALLAQTVSCARCHNHKFDPISQADFYALYGVFASCRPALVTVDAPGRLTAHNAQLALLKHQIRQQMANTWLQTLDSLPATLAAPTGAWQARLAAAANQPHDPLQAWTQLAEIADGDFAKAWQTLRTEADALDERLAAQRDAANALRWDLAGDDYQQWGRHGAGLAERPSPAGDFHLLAADDKIIANIYPAGVYTHSLSTRHNGLLTSPRFKIDSDRLSVRVAGAGARVRFVVQNYPRIEGPIYGATKIERETPGWVHFNTKYWRGDWAYVEVATEGDLPVGPAAPEARGWFGITEAVVSGDGSPQPADLLGAENAVALAQLTKSAKPTSAAELAALYQSVLSECIAAWRDEKIDDAQAGFLAYFVRHGLLANSLALLPDVGPLVAQYRQLEAEIPAPTRAPGIVEGDAFDQPLLVRGNHKQPGELVPRRYLEAFGAEPFNSTGSGRLELAERIASGDNPLTARVLVNRVWHHLFGRGLVATPDSFGHLGEEPTHPELLDYLATRFVDEGWSIKKLVRLMVTSRAFQQSSIGSDAAQEIDPTNRLLAHFPIRRLSAEAIRDSILSASGTLEETMYGPSAAGQSSRRSLYVAQHRNRLDPLLATFDAPEPHTTRGRRDATNVPAQSLLLLNDPWVIDRSRRFAARVERDTSLADDTQRVTSLYRIALGRLPDAQEIEQCLAYIESRALAGEKNRERMAALNQQCAEITARVESMLGPVRAKLLADRDNGTDVRNPLEPSSQKPIARWTFETGLEDSLGSLHGQAFQGAHVESGALVVDGRGYVATKELEKSLHEKTLQAWVQLANLDQRGGGVMSVQTLNGVTFDALVYGEQQPREWLAGSNFFRRTQPFRGPPEVQAAEQPVQVSIVYQADGMIHAYRNGEPYGSPYRSAGLQAFDAKKAQIVFGMRHGPPGGNKMLAGRILHAELFERALSAEEVAASASSLGNYIPLEQILAALNEKQRREHDDMIAQLRRLQFEIDELRPVAASETIAPNRWQNLAHAIFNLKEFIYVQ